MLFCYLLYTFRPLSFQIDGEPFGERKNKVIHVSLRNQVLMLTPSKTSKEEQVVNVFNQVMASAEKSGVISPQQRTVLWKEFAIRYNECFPSSSFYQND
jgi:hypothetical protein